VYWNKVSAVGLIKEQVGRPEALTLYVGDDVTDEDAFVALTGEITVKVSESSETAAHYQVYSPSDVHRFLEWMNGLLHGAE
jgi:trehalose-phosphatase